MQLVQDAVVGSSGSEVAGADGLLVARRPVFDRARQVAAYDVRFRALPAGGGLETSVLTTGPAASARQVLDRSGLELLTRGRPAFLRMSSERLGPAVTDVFPPGRVIVEVPCATATPQAILADCRALRDAGYAVSLDELRLTEESQLILPFANFVRRDVLHASSQERLEIVAAARKHHVGIVAAGVEAQDVFDQAVREGFTHFQGYFFERVGKTRRQIAPDQLVQLRLLRALTDPDRSIADIENLVKRDAALSYRVLRLANSAGFAQAMQVVSMRHALLLVGKDTVCRWASLAVVAGIGATSPDELVTMATIRARLCERLAGLGGKPSEAGLGFLVGLCSLLDAMLGLPMADVLDQLPVAKVVSDALLGRDTDLRRLLECATAYERGDWDVCLKLVAHLNINPRDLTPAYLDALQWAHELQIPAAGTA